MSLLPTENKGTMNLPNPVTPPYTALPHQFKLTNLINDFSSVYSDPSLKFSAKVAILVAQTEYMQSLMAALIKTVPNTEGVKSE